jgi:hypothetical protein
LSVTWTPRSLHTNNRPRIAGSGSTFTQFNGTSGRFPLMSVQLAPKFAVRKILGRREALR